jgi:alkylation response protein AidB-like acyl-CoA dehydrogenase
MDLRYPAAAEEFRRQVRAILQQELPPGWQGYGALPPGEARPFLDAWRRKLHERRLLGLTWPREFGGAGRTALDQVVLVEELARAGAPAGWPTDNFSIKMLGNTLLRLGTQAQQRAFLPPILSGAHRWCQGFSEPGAGSDLAGLQARAELAKGDGEAGAHWRINGQKIWTSNARDANWIFLLARTDPDAPKHRGISFLLCPLEQPGIEIRPITMLSGQREFNEVFFTDARTDAANVVGEVNQGWQVATALLAYERGDEAATNPILFRHELDRLVAMAAERGRANDPVIRERLAWCYARVETMRFLGYRTLTGVLKGRPPGTDSSVSKLYWSEYHRVVTELAVDVLGADVLAPEGRAPLRTARTDDPGARNSSASWLGAFYNARAGTIYAGTSQIQRTIIAERVLGLPKDPSPRPR